MDCQPLKLPNITLPTSGTSGSPRTRSASLSVAGSPMGPPFSPVGADDDTFGEAASSGPGEARRDSLGAPKVHNKGHSIQMQPIRANIADPGSIAVDSARKRQIRGSPDSLDDELDDQHRFASDDGDDGDEDDLLDEEMRMLGGDIPQQPRRYDGPFQKPGSKELMAILLSFTAVALLAVAAGLTTIYDWVL